MMVTYTCPSCCKDFSVPEWLTEDIKCPQCGARAQEFVRAGQRVDSGAGGSVGDAPQMSGASAEPLTGNASVDESASTSSIPGKQQPGWAGVSGFARHFHAKALGGAVRDAVPHGFMTRRRRIAITGLANTGKTVFLTTLLSHLNHHEPADFRIFDKTDVTVKQFTEDQPEDDLVKFDYSIFAQSMRTGRWPQKTLDVSAYKCHFKMDNRWVNHQIEFLDWPGERVADIVMYNRDYAAWSDNLLKRWDISEPTYREHVTPYLDAVDCGDFEEQSILHQYRLALARLILDYNPLISPSCFLLGRDGSRLRGSCPEELAKAGIIGVNHDSQFAPLPREAREREPRLASVFADRYNDYRRQIVFPLFEAVQRCNRLIVLVDIPSILASGHGRLNDNYDMIVELVNGLGANSSKATGVIKGIWHSVAPASWMWMGVEKIAFVATKADLVAGDQNRDNMRLLLEQMLRDIKNRIPSVEVGFFVASPVKSTSQPANGSFLMGRLMFDGQGKRLAPDAPEQTYETSTVPSRWPDQWLSGQYHFPSVYPAVPQGRFMLPKHIGLDRVLQFALD